MSSTGRERYLAILRQHDSDSGWAAPPDFDHAAAERQFRTLAAAVKRAAGVPLRAESAVQDASFFGRIFLGGALLIAEPVLPDTILLRVSNWGGLATVSDEMALTAGGLAQVIELLGSNEYRYIPPQILSGPYTGTLPTNGAVSWWQRFFD